MLSYSMAFILKTKSMKHPPLIFSWEICIFLKVAEAAARSRKRPGTLLKRDSNTGIFL